MEPTKQDEAELEELEYREEIDGQVTPAPCQEAFCAWLDGLGCQPCGVDLRILQTG